jgi:hypothetical protein
VKGANRVFSLIHGGGISNCSSRGKTVMGILWIEDVSLVCQSIDNSILVKSLMHNKKIIIGAQRILEDCP